MWHDDVPIGICVFQSPPLSLAARHRYFGLSGRRSKLQAQALNAQLWTLSRVVLHPTYRGAGLAAWFVWNSCRASGRPWIEVLAELGHLHPLFERAGFVRVGVGGPPAGTRQQHSDLFGRRRGDGHGRVVSDETHAKSRYARPVYYIFDNRASLLRGAGTGCAGGGRGPDNSPDAAGQ